MRAFHARYPGITSATLSYARTPAGLSSYELLAGEVARLAHSPRTILDLACGDGYLLALLGNRFADARLVGIDMSPEELAAARDRLQARAELQLAHAAALPLEDGSCDVVTCHLAFMLMEDASTIVKEIARVLVPGGIFTAVINGGGAADPVLRTFIQDMHRAEAAEELPPLSIGDPRIQSASDLHEMFDEHFRTFTLEDLTLALDGAPSQVRDALMGFYNLYRLSPEGCAMVRDRLENVMSEHIQPNGTVPCTLPIRHIRAIKR